MKKTFVLEKTETIESTTVFTARKFDDKEDAVKAMKEEFANFMLTHIDWEVGEIDNTSAVMWEEGMVGENLMKWEIRSCSADDGILTNDSLYLYSKVCRVLTAYENGDDEFETEDFYKVLIAIQKWMEDLGF